MRTVFPRKEDFIDGTRPREWWVVDAEGETLGRLATRIANVLRGKHKPIHSYHVDTGDFVVVLNAGKIRVTGNKELEKMYHHHTGYPGGIRSTTAGKILKGKHPERVVEKAVQRMIPKGPLGRQVLSKLKVYAGSEHPHEAQQPEILNVAAMNAKNKRSA